MLGGSLLNKGLLETAPIPLKIVQMPQQGPDFSCQMQGWPLPAVQQTFTNGPEEVVGRDKLLSDSCVVSILAKTSFKNVTI